MTRDEIAKNIANRFVHSGTYIILYLAMAGLSLATVVLSLVNDCPTLPFYILELVINGAMILEVAIRFVAFGRVSRIAQASQARTPPDLILPRSNSGSRSGISWIWS